MTLILNKKKWYAQQITDYQANLYRLALSLLRNEEDAEDALQEALCTGYEKLDTLKDPDKFRPWMMQIVNNASYDILRKRKNLMNLDDVETLPAAAPALSRSEAISLKDAVASLPTGYRAVVILFYYEDMTVRQISQITGVSQSVVKTRLFRARQLLKKVLDE